MSVVDEVTAANERYAAGFAKGELPMPPGRRHSRPQKEQTSDARCIWTAASVRGSWRKPMRRRGRSSTRCGAFPFDRVPWPA